MTLQLESATGPLMKAVYDTLFVELADREQVPLMTYGRKLLKAYPDIACRPG